MSVRRIPDQVLAEIRDRLPIQDVLGRSLPLRRSGRTWRAACPLCGSRSQALVADPARQSYHCFACGAHGDVIGWTMRAEGCDFRQAVARCAADAGMDWQEKPGGRRAALPPPPPRPPAPDEAARREAAARKWARGVPIAEGSPQARYLAGRRLWPLPPAAHAVLRAATLRYPPDGVAPDLTWPAGQRPHPVLIALVQAPGLRLTAVHCTFLQQRPDGSVGKLQVEERPSKLVFGPLPRGAAIRLMAPEAVMGVAEGIETALAAARLFGLPVWAAISAGGVERWLPPRIASEIVIFADNDRPRTGARWRPEGEGLHVARELQARLREEGRTARIRVPLPPAGDYADVLLAQELAA